MTPTSVQDNAQIDVQIATAKKWPRNITRAIDNAVAIITADMEMAEKANYSVKRGKNEDGTPKIVTGPSIHLAKLLAQQFGNMRIEARVTEITDKQVISAGIAWDLETNIAARLEIRRGITSRKYGRYSDDMITVTGNAANSIALRNAILAVIPASAVEKCRKAARNKIAGNVSTKDQLVARVKEVTDALRDTFNVTEAEILQSIGRASIKLITADDIVTLVGYGTAIKDGDSTVDETFRAVKVGAEEPSITEDDLATLYGEKKDKLTAEERKDAERIMAGKEVTSYKKLHKKLTAK